MSPSVEWGDFYSGTRRQLTFDVTVRARPGVMVYLGSEFNMVSLPEGRFQSRFRWILKPGNDFYFVYLQNWLDDLALTRFSTLSRRAASKFLYTQRF